MTALAAFRAASTDLAAHWDDDQFDDAWDRFLAATLALIGGQA